MADYIHFLQANTTVLPNNFTQGVNAKIVDITAAIQSVRDFMLSWIISRDVLMGLGDSNEAGA